MEFRTLEPIFNDGRYSDVLLEFDDGDRTFIFNGISAVLAANSPFFQALFSWQLGPNEAHLPDTQDSATGSSRTVLSGFSDASEFSGLSGLSGSGKTIKFNKDQKPIIIVVDPQLGSLEDLVELLEWMYYIREKIAEGGWIIAKNLFLMFPYFCIYQFDQYRGLFSCVGRGCREDTISRKKYHRSMAGRENLIILNHPFSHSNEDFAYLTHADGREIQSTVLIGSISNAEPENEETVSVIETIEFYRTTSYPKEFDQLSVDDRVVDILIVVRGSPVSNNWAQVFSTYISNIITVGSIDPDDYIINQRYRFITMTTALASLTMLRFIIANNYTSDDVRNFIINDVYQGRISMEFYDPPRIRETIREEIRFIQKEERCRACLMPLPPNIFPGIYSPPTKKTDLITNPL